jgi:histone deacetylase 1/2
MAYETRLEMLQDQYNKARGQYQSSANNAMRGHGGFNRGRGSGNRGRGRGGRGTGGQGNNFNSNNYDGQKGSSNSKPKCQMCNSTSHTVVNCWYRYDDDAETNTKSAGLASSYGYDTNWYVDSGASDHITADLKKITVKEKYNNGDQVHTANGSGMSISAIGHSVLHTPKSSLAS